MSAPSAAAVCAVWAALAAAAGAPQTSYTTGEAAVDRLHAFLAPTLAANEKSFVGATGPVRAFGAGSIYPQIWLRDSATLLPLARYHYGRPHLTSWIEEHFAHQAPEGALWDWVAPGPTGSFAEWAPHVTLVHRAGSLQVSADKNTVEADQETSAVIAVGRVFEVTGDLAWLRRPVSGVSLLERCERALEFLLAARRDPGTGLITSGFSADWGDVSPQHPDQRAIYLDEETPLVVGLYTNALFFQAASALADLYDAAGLLVTADRWRTEARRIRRGVEATLWQPSRGFYRMHRLVRGGKSLPDDADIFALGGHAVAVQAGLVDGVRARALFTLAEKRRASHGVSTISGSLLPPFPKGTFPNPAVAEPWSYQNGGQWDWFGGRFVLAEFEQGRSESAWTHLVEIATKAVAAGGLHEWHTREGEGRGSATYAGSAGALGDALYRGLFGVDLRASRLHLKVRLGERSGRLDLLEPATATRIEYRYTWTPEVATLEYKSSHREPGRISVRLPAKPRGLPAVTIDGTEVDAYLTTVGDDHYVEVRTDWGSHRLEIRPR